MSYNNHNDYNVIDISGKSSSPNDTYYCSCVVGNYSTESRTKRLANISGFVPFVILNTYRIIS